MVPNIVREKRSRIRKAEACDPNTRKQSGISTVRALLLLRHRVRLQISNSQTENVVRMDSADIVALY